MSAPEAWLRGPIEGIDPLLMPAAHALLQAAEEIEAALTTLSNEELWMRPGGAAAAGFHAAHLAGSIERLLTYAHGRQLDEEQLRARRDDADPGDPIRSAAHMTELAVSAIRLAIRELRAVDTATLLDAREVGRKRLPSTVLGLLFHLAEHTQRHTGQLVTTARIVRALAGR